jgi:hypothetical protein
MVTGGYNITPGADVLTRDGDKIGEVGEMRGTFFKVNANMQPDYWLETDTVGEVTGNRVMLVFDKDDLGDYKHDNPGTGI